MNEEIIVEPILNEYLRKRKTRYANSHNVSIESVKVVNTISISDLFSKWKKENNIKTKLFKNLSEEQKNMWIQYFDTNKTLMLISNENQSPITPKTKTKTKTK